MQYKYPSLRIVTTFSITPFTVSKTYTFPGSTNKSELILRTNTLEPGGYSSAMLFPVTVIANSAPLTGDTTSSQSYFFTPIANSLSLVEIKTNLFYPNSNTFFFRHM